MWVPLPAPSSPVGGAQPPSPPGPSTCLQVDDGELPLGRILDWRKFSVLYRGSEAGSCGGMASLLANVTDERYRDLRANLLLVQPFFLWTQEADYGDAFWMTMLTVKKTQERLAAMRQAGAPFHPGACEAHRLICPLPCSDESTWESDYDSSRAAPPPAKTRR